MAVDAAQGKGNNERLIGQVAELIRRMQKGDVRAFDQLYTLTTSYVQFIVRKQMSQDDDWEDVVQEVFINIFQQYDKLKNPQAGLAWIKQIAYRKACDHNRKKYRINDAVDQSYDVSDAVDVMDDSLPLPEDLLVSQESQRAVRQALSELTDVQQNAMIGYYYNEMKTREIAEAMGIPEGTVKTALARGRKVLKEKLETGYGKILSVSGGGSAFAAFLSGEANAQAITIPGLAETLHRLAEEICAEIALSAGAGSIAAGSSAAGSTAITGASAGAGAAAAKTVLPLVIAAVVAAGSVGGGISTYRHHDDRKQISTILQEQEQRRQKQESDGREGGFASEADEANNKQNDMLSLQGTVWHTDSLPDRTAGIRHMLAVLVRYCADQEVGVVRLDDNAKIAIAACAFPIEEDEAQSMGETGVISDRLLQDETTFLFGHPVNISGLPDTSSYDWQQAEVGSQNMGDQLMVAKGEDGIHLSAYYAGITPVAYTISEVEVQDDGSLLVTADCKMEPDHIEENTEKDFILQTGLHPDTDSACGYVIDRVRFTLKEE